LAIQQFSEKLLVPDLLALG